MELLYKEGGESACLIGPYGIAILLFLASVGLGAIQSHAIFYKDWSGTSPNRTGPPKLVGSSHRHH